MILKVVIIATARAKNECRFVKIVHQLIFLVFFYYAELSLFFSSINSSTYLSETVLLSSCGIITQTKIATSRLSPAKKYIIPWYWTYSKRADPITRPSERPNPTTISTYPTYFIIWSLNTLVMTAYPVNYSRQSPKPWIILMPHAAMKNILLSEMYDMRPSPTVDIVVSTKPKRMAFLDPKMFLRVELNGAIKIYAM
jgi:hypothetical protein